MIKYTAKNPFDRFPDGRPKVDDKILERVKGSRLKKPGACFRSTAISISLPAGTFRFCILDKSSSAAQLPPNIFRRGPIWPRCWMPTQKRRNIAKEPNQKVIDLLEPNDVPVID